MESMTIKMSVLGGQRQIESEATYEGEGKLEINTDLPAGVAAAMAAGVEATLTARSGDGAGTITLPSGHGLTSDDFDIYWEGGARYAVPSVIAQNAMTLDGGTGDPLPPQGTAVVVEVARADEEGVVALPSGHGLTTGTFDVYWPGGLRHGVPGTVLADALTLDGGVGDRLPAPAAAVVAATPVSIVFPLQGDLLVAIVARCSKTAHLDFLSAAPASLRSVPLSANRAWPWADDWGYDNPLDGVTVATIAASCGDSAEAGGLTIQTVFDAVA